MSIITPRDRLCAEILGGNLSFVKSDLVSISIPIYYSDIGPAVLRAAQEAVYEMPPEQVRQTLPFVLDAIEENSPRLVETGYLNSFLFSANHHFYLSSSDEYGPGPEYSSEYRQGWVAPVVSAMNRFEHGWALAWVLDLLENGNSVLLFHFEQDLIMFSRILSMALDHPESEARAFRHAQGK